MKKNCLTAGGSGELLSTTVPHVMIIVTFSMWILFGRRRLMTKNKPDQHRCFLIDFFSACALIDSRLPQLLKGPIRVDYIDLIEQTRCYAENSL